MDSVTQLALGAAVGHAVMGRHLGRRALAWGAVVGTLPDLDLLLPLGDPVAVYTWHRSWSHSVFVLTALAPWIARLGRRIHPATGEHRRGWLWMVLLVLWTHVLLDCFTVYGTQILWPLPFAPVAWSTIFIIDPLYTLPLLVGIGGAAFGRRRWNAVGLVFSTLYLLWTVGAKWHVERVAAAALTRDGITASAVLTTPAPSNTLLWRVIVMRENGYAEGYYSLVAPGDELAFRWFSSDLDLLDGLREHPPVERLSWFSHGFYTVGRGDENDSEIVFTDLRMGSEPDYFFRFVVGRLVDGAPTPVAPRKLTTPVDPARLAVMWGRIWTADVSVVPGGS